MVWEIQQHFARFNSSCGHFTRFNSSNSSLRDLTAVADSLRDLAAVVDSLRDFRAFLQDLIAVAADSKVFFLENNKGKAAEQIATAKAVFWRTRREKQSKLR